MIWILTAGSIYLLSLLVLLTLVPVWQALVGAMALTWIVVALLILACCGFDLVVRAGRSR